VEKRPKTIHRGRNVTMKHYWEIYKKFVSTSISEATSFRLSFFLVAIMDIIFYLTTLFSVNFIFDHVQNIGPWDKNQLLFFISFMLAIDHLHMTTISESFWRFSDHIRTGSLDFLLLRPVHAIFSVFFSRFRAATVFNGIVAWGFLIYYGNQVNLPFLSWLLLPFMVLIGMNLLLVIEIILSTAMFWIVEGAGINFLRMQIQQLSRWPDFIFSKYTRRVLTLVIPISLVGTAPVQFLLDFKNYQYLLFLILFSFILWAFLLIWWNYAIQKYESASS